MFLERCPDANFHDIPKLPQRNIQTPCLEHTPRNSVTEVWWWKYFNIFQTEVLPLLFVRVGGGWREFVVTRNVLATAWITLLTPEEADNLSAAQQGRLNVTRQPNHLLMKAWQRRAEPPCRERKFNRQIWASVGLLHGYSFNTSKNIWWYWWFQVQIHWLHPVCSSSSYVDQTNESVLATDLFLNWFKIWFQD